MNEIVSTRGKIQVEFLGFDYKTSNLFELPTLVLQAEEDWSKEKVNLPFLLRMVDDFGPTDWSERLSLNHKLKKDILYWCISKGYVFENRSSRVFYDLIHNRVQRIQIPHPVISLCSIERNCVLSILLNNGIRVEACSEAKGFPTNGELSHVGKASVSGHPCVYRIMFPTDNIIDYIGDRQAIADQLTKMVNDEFACYNVSVEFQPFS